MIPILYAPGETDFSRNGVGMLADALKCTVTEKRNGSYEMTLEYPTCGQLYDKIVEDSIIKAKPNDTSAPQLFRVYRSTKNLSGRTTYYAEHISYRLNGIPLISANIHGVPAQDALAAVLKAGAVEHGFTADSDIKTANSINLSLVSLRSALGGVSGSILDVYGGEYEWDNFTVRLHAHRGKDNGVRISYGKNLTDLRQESNISEAYTGIMPYARYTVTDDSGNETEYTVTLPEQIIVGAHADYYAHARIEIVDFSESFGEGEITVPVLRKIAQEYVETSDFDLPKINIKVSFQSLWQSPEYAAYASLERVSLCDTVTIDFPGAGSQIITAKAKVIETVYDALSEKYVSIELGDARADLADTIKNVVSESSELKEQVRRTDEKVADQGRALQGLAKTLAESSGLYITVEAQQDRSSIYYMHDKPQLADSQIVWKLTAEAIGISTDGGESYPYGFKITGELITRLLYAVGIDADYINAGAIKSKNYSAGKTGMKLTLSDGSWDSPHFKLTTSGAMTVTSGKIGDWEITSDRLRYVGDTRIVSLQGSASGGQVLYVGTRKSTAESWAYPFKLNGNGTVECTGLDAQGYLIGGSWGTGIYTTMLNNLGICLTSQSQSYQGGQYRGWILQMDDRTGNLVAVPAVYMPSDNSWYTQDKVVTLATWSATGSGTGGGGSNKGGGGSGRLPTQITFD